MRTTTALDVKTIPMSQLREAGIDTGHVDYHWDPEYGELITLLHAEAPDGKARCVFGQALPMLDLPCAASSQRHPGWTFETQELDAFGRWVWTGYVSHRAPGDLVLLLNDVREYMAGRTHTGRGQSERKREVFLTLDYLDSLGLPVDRMYGAGIERDPGHPWHLTALHSHTDGHRRALFGFEDGEWVLYRQRAVVADSENPAERAPVWQPASDPMRWSGRNLDGMIRALRMWDL